MPCVASRNRQALLGCNLKRRGIRYHGNFLLLQVARQKVLALRRQREAEAQEAERLRKEAAAAKLKALEERIARKEAAERSEILLFSTLVCMHWVYCGLLDGFYPCEQKEFFDQH